MNISGGDCISAPPVINSIIPLPPQPFTVTKTVSDSNPANGTEITYTISICKSIAPEINNIQLIDILSPGLTGIIPNDFTLLGNELSATVSLPSSQPGVQVCQNLSFSATVDYQLAGEGSIPNCIEAEIINSGCATVSNCVTITDPATDSGFTYDLVECSNTMNFNSLEVGTHEWKVGSTVFSSAPNPTYTFPGPGTYIITHTLNGYLASQQTFTFVGTDQSSVTLSSSLPSNNLIDQFMLVNGTLQINNAFSMINVDGRMASGSHILVENDHSLGVRISHFRACDDMWKGFETQAGAHLTLALCTVEDAQYAVKSDGTPVGSEDPISNIGLTGNSFDLNFIGVYVPRSGSGKAQSINFSLFHSNTFDCTSDLKDGYNGQVNGPGLPPLGSKAYAGVWVAELTEMGIGASNAPSINTFQNLHLGIYAERTVILEVAQSRFFNIYPAPFYYNLNFAGGNGIWVNAQLGSPFMLTQTGLGDEGPFSFQNCSRGIFSNGVNVHLSQNNMDQMLTGITVQGCRGGNIDILDNDIIAKNFGIELLQNDHSSTHIYVFDNDIDVGNAGGLPLNSRAGISIQDNNIPYTDAVIYDNRINTFNARFGIRLRTCAGASVLKNTVSLQGVGFAGVSLQGCNGGVLEDNNISRPTLNAISTGIQIVNSPGVNYCCNTVNRTNIGISLEGNCDSPDNFQANQFYEHNIGLLASPENLAVQTVLGAQIHMGNRWHEDEQTIPVGAQHNGGIQIAQNSAFRVNTNISDFLPNVVYPLIWFDPNDSPNTGCSLIPDCGLCNFDCLGGSPTDFERKLANDSLSVLAYNEVVKWTGERNLYRKLVETPDYITSIEGMQGFYDNSVIGTVGKLYNVETGKEGLFDLDTAAQAKLDDYLLQVEQYLSQIKVKRELLINASPGDSISLVSDLNNLQFQLSLYADSLSIITATINDEIKAGAISLEGYNNSISTLDSYEDNESAVNRLVLTSIQNGSLEFTSSEQTELMNIANQCPFIGGMAVFSARSLLAVSNDTLAFDDETLCQELEERAALGERSRHLPGTFELFPNPTNGWVTALYPAAGATDKTTLRIYDLSGREAASILLPNETQAWSFSLSHLPGGIYFCKLFINDTFVGVKRLAVFH